MSAVCEAFGCPPSVAEEQDLTTVQAVLDYRMARAARDTFNQPDRARAFEALQANPELLRMLSMMHRAQSGLPLEGSDMEDEGLAVAGAHRTGSRDEEDEDGDAR